MAASKPHSVVALPSVSIVVQNACTALSTRVPHELVLSLGRLLQQEIGPVSWTTHCSSLRQRTKISRSFVKKPLLITSLRFVLIQRGYVLPLVTCVTREFLFAQSLVFRWALHFRTLKPTKLVARSL